MARWYVILTIACCLFLAADARAQMSPGGHPPAIAAGIMNALPSDVLGKVQRLAQMLQQNINEGKISEAQIQRELLSGNLQQTIKSINPEASHLLEDITASLKSSPNAEDLPDLLGGLTGHIQ